MQNTLHKLSAIADNLASVTKSFAAAANATLPHSQQTSGSASVIGQGTVTTIQDSVVQAILPPATGNISALPSPSMVTTFKSSTIPLGINVPEKIRTKILADEFVDLGQILTPSDNNNLFTLALCGNNYTVAVVPSTKIPHFIPIFQFTP